MTSLPLEKRLSLAWIAKTLALKENLQAANFLIDSQFPLLSWQRRALEYSCTKSSSSHCEDARSRVVW